MLDRDSQRIAQLLEGRELVPYDEVRLWQGLRVPGACLSVALALAGKHGGHVVLGTAKPPSLAGRLTGELPHAWLRR